jgi:hypothetical protein
MGEVPVNGGVMVIRVGVSDAESAKHLVAGLAGFLGGESVSLQADGEVQVRLRRDSRRQTIVQTLTSVERWLEDTGTSSVDVWLGERPYTLERPRPVPDVA